MFLRRYNLPVVDRCRDHVIFVVPFLGNNLQLDDEDVVLGINLLNVLHQLHDV